MKYLLTQAQREAVLRALEPHMALDPYGRTVIRNLYLDTESYRLIRRSIEKPVYKEKMRIRCYGPAHPDSPVFVELKKKYILQVRNRLSDPDLSESAEGGCALCLTRSSGGCLPPTSRWSSA